MSSSSRTAPSPRFGSSFAQCFGATAPVSPPCALRHNSCAAGGRARGVNYRRLGLDDFESDGNEDEVYGCRAATEAQEQSSPEESFRRGGGSSTVLKLGKHSSFREKPSRREVVYASEGEQEKCRGERKGVWKLGKERAGRRRLSASEALKKSRCLCELEEEKYVESAREAKGTWGHRLRREKAMKEGVYIVEAEERSSPRRASFGARMKEACVQALETAKRGSPHLSELFVGNLLLMQVTSSSFIKRHPNKHRAPSFGLHDEFSGDPSFSTIPMSSPANSTSSAF